MPEQNGLPHPLLDHEYRYVHRDFADSECKRLNKVDNPARKGVFEVREDG